MKNRWLLIGIIVLLVLGYFARQHRAERRPAHHRGPIPGAALLSIDINDVAKFDYFTASSTATLIKTESGWVESHLWNYPAEFDHVSETLRQVNESKVGQVVRGGTNMLDELGLADDTNKIGDLRPSTLTLYDGSGKKLAVLTIGQRRQAQSDDFMGRAEGTYVRVGHGAVVLVDADLTRIPRSPVEWINGALLNVPVAEIESISVSSTSSTYTIHSGGAGGYTIDGLGPDEEVQKDAAAALFQVLQPLSFANVVDPALSEATLGLEKPQEFEAHSRDGITYIVHLGSLADGINRYARLFAFYNKPKPPAVPGDGADEKAKKDYEQQKQVYDETAKRQVADVEKLTTVFSKWTYVLPMYSCNTMLTDRSALVKKIEKPESTPSTNEAPVDNAH